MYRHNHAFTVPACMTENSWLLETCTPHCTSGLDLFTVKCGTGFHTGFFFLFEKGGGGTIWPPTYQETVPITNVLTLLYESLW